MGEVSPPLPALHPVLPRLPNQNPLLPRRVVLGEDGAEVVGRDGDEDLPAACVRLPGPLGAGGGERLVRALLVADKVVDVQGGAGGDGLCSLRHSDGGDEGGIDPWLAGHLGRDGVAAFGAGELALSNPFLEALEAEVVAAWRLQQEEVGEEDDESETPKQEIWLGGNILKNIWG